MKNNLLKITSILVIVALVLSAFTTISKATEQSTFELDKDYIEVQAGKTASFTITSNKSQEFYLVSANENVCTIFDPQGSTILSSEFKLAATTKTFAISATAPGETVIRVNAGYLPTDDGAGTYETTREIMKEIVNKIIDVCPEFKGFLVPECIYRGNICHEFKSCEKMNF